MVSHLESASETTYSVFERYPYIKRKAHHIPTSTDVSELSCVIFDVRCTCMSESQVRQPIMSVCYFIARCE